MNDDDDSDAVHLPFLSELGNYEFGQRFDRRATLLVVAPGASAAMKALKFSPRGAGSETKLPEETQEHKPDLDTSPAPPNQIIRPAHNTYKTPKRLEMQAGRKPFSPSRICAPGRATSSRFGGTPELTVLLGRTASAAYTSIAQRPPAVVRAVSAWVAEGGSREMGRLVPKILHGIPSSPNLLESFRFLTRRG